MPKRTGVKDRIYRVGVELEGGWENVPLGARIEHDGSVQIPGGIDAQSGASSSRPLVDPSAHPSRPMPRILMGEIPSPVLDMKTYADWMRTHYPQHVNETCGLHTHVSFQYRINYMRLMTPDFTPYVVNGLLKWAEEQKLGKDHPIWPRLSRKDHKHCAHIYLGDAQVRVTRKDWNSRGTSYSRYTAINYCWEQQVQKTGDRGTVECRLLPMMETADQAVSAVTEVFNLTNKFLSEVRKKEPRAEAKVALAPMIAANYRHRV